MTASRALVSDANGKVAVSGITSTILGYLSGVSSNIQTQLNGKANSTHSHSYLPLSGGTVTGNLTVNGTVNAANPIQFAGNRCVYWSESNHLFFAASATPVYYMGTAGSYRFGSDNFVPGANDVASLGSSNYKWKNVYATKCTGTSSDRNMKDKIIPLKDNEKWLQLFMKLVPVSFMFNSPGSDRTHVGFISQDVEDAMSELGMTSLDFAGFCKDVKTKFIIDENGIEKEVPDLDSNGKEQYIYSLRYGEFVALVTLAVQDTINKQEELEERITKLESLVNS